MMKNCGIHWIDPDPGRPILAFLDAETCSTVHWPSFGSNKHDSWDKEGDHHTKKQRGGNM